MRYGVVTTFLSCSIKTLAEDNFNKLNRKKYIATMEPFFSLVANYIFNLSLN